LVGNQLFDLKLIAIILGISYGKFYHWYKEHLSGFRSKQVQESLHEHDFTTASGKKIAVPICRKEEIGSQMLLDEKHINGDFHTILSNQETGNVAVILQTVNPYEIGQFLVKLKAECQKVEVVSRDMAPGYERVCTENFPKATQVSDKFHVIAKGIDHLQDLRNELKKKEADLELKQESERKKLLKELKMAEKRLLKSTQKKEKSKIEKAILSLQEKLKSPEFQSIRTGESKVEMLSRGRYLLYKEPLKWTVTQQKRATLLFDNFPKLEKYHNALCQFGSWYRPETEQEKDGVSNTWRMLNKQTALQTWVETHENTTIVELKRFVKMVKRHEESILAYHETLRTNAKAESINAKIEEAKRKNRGTRDLDFFFFRLGKIV
jgi:transposase